MRKANLIQTAIWLDQDFAALPVDAKLVYLLLITQPDVSHVGVLTLAATRWARQTGLTPKRFQTALRNLVDHRFIILDQATDELLIRSWVKHNLAGSKLEQAGKTHFALVGSPLLRWALQTEHSNLFGDPPPDTLSHTLSDTRSLKRGDREGDRYREVVGSSSVERAARASIDQVWAEYAQRYPRSVLTLERKATIAQWLHVYPVATLTAAIAGNHLDPHCNGENDRGQQYHSFELIFRDSKHIEDYALLAANGAPQPRLKGAEATMQLARQQAQREGNQ